MKKSILDDPAFKPPPIAPVAEGVHRPLWSVMIPTFNCAKYLRQTLESVLAQDPGAEQMQIEVIDDCSTKDDPEAVVKEIGKGRVAFYRKPKNEGAIANFNTCIERSRGHLVHILHGDDYVLPGFYDEIKDLATINEPVAGFFVRCFVVNVEGDILSLAERIPQLETPSQKVSELLYKNVIWTPGVVIRRAFYEEFGGFLPPLVHVADWEMWLRVIQNGGGGALNKPLACYRSFDGNDTGRLAKTGEIIKDNMRLCSILSETASGFQRQRFIENVANLALSLKERFEVQGDTEASEVNGKLWKELAPRTPISKRVRLMLGSAKRILRQR